jgi:Tfp pilus assembly protein PilE
MTLKTQEGSAIVRLLILIAIVGLVAAIEIPRRAKNRAEEEMWQCRQNMLSLQRAQIKHYAVHKRYSTDIDSLSAFLMERNDYFRGMIDSMQSFLRDSSITFEINRANLSKVDSLRSYLEGERSAYIDTLVDLRNLLLSEHSRVKLALDSLRVLKEETEKSYDAEIDSLKNTIYYNESHPMEVEGFTACLDSLEGYFPEPLEPFCPRYPHTRYDLEVLSDKVYIKCFYEKEHGRIDEGEASW